MLVQGAQRAGRGRGAAAGRATRRVRMSAAAPSPLPLSPLPPRASSFATLSEAVVTLVVSVLGVGMLGMPYVFASAGWAQATVLLAAFSLLAAASKRLLLRAAHACGRRTYEEVAEAALGPKGRRLVEVLVCGLQFGMLVACLNTAADALGGVATSVVPAGAEPGRASVLLAVGLLAVAPICVLLRTADRAAKASAVAIGIVLALMCAVAAVAADVRLGLDRIPAGVGVMGRAPPVAPPPLQAWRAGSVLRVLPVLAFSLNAHTSLFPIYAGLRFSSLGRINSVVGRTMTISAACYGLVGICGYAAFGAKTAGDVLRNFDGHGRERDFERVVKVAYALFAVLGAPLIVIPLRTALDSLLSGSSSSGGGKDAAAAVSPPHMTRSRSSVARAEEFRRRVGDAAATIWMVGAAVAAGVAMPNLQDVIALTGATASILLGQVLPSLLYLRLCCGPNAVALGGTRARHDQRSSRRAVQALMVGALVAMVMCTQATLKTYEEEETVLTLAKELRRRDTEKQLADKFNLGAEAVEAAGLTEGRGGGGGTDDGNRGAGGQASASEAHAVVQPSHHVPSAIQSAELSELEHSLVDQRHRTRESELVQAAEIAGALERVGELKKKKRTVTLEERVEEELEAVAVVEEELEEEVEQAFEVVETRVKTALAGGGDAPLDERTLPGDKGATLEAVLPHSKHRREDHATLVGFEEKEIAVGADKEEARA